MGAGQYAKVNNMIELENIEIEVVTDPKEIYTEANELESIIFDLNSRIEMLSSKADKWDCLVALGSGIVYKCIETVMHQHYNGLNR